MRAVRLGLRVAFLMCCIIVSSVGLWWRGAKVDARIEVGKSLLRDELSIQLEFQDGSTLAEARSPLCPSDLFHFWLLESVSTWENSPLGNDQVLYENARWHREDGNVRQTSAIPGVYSYHLLLKPSRNKVDISIRLTNQSSETWSNTTLAACFQMKDAPSLRDSGGERTFTTVDGQLVPVIRTERQKPIQWQNYLLADRRIPIRRGMAYGHQPLSPQRVSNGLIGILSKDERKATGVVWSCVGYVFYNFCSDFACIHSTPLLGRMKPAQTKEITGSFYLIDGGINELEAQARVDYGRELGNCSLGELE